MVNALSARLDIIIFRNGREYAIGFENGIKTRDLVPVKDTEPDRTGTSVHFYPNPDFFERTTFSTSVIQTALKSKAVLCPGLTTCFVDENTGDRQTWVFDHGLDQYLAESLKDHDTLFDQPFTGECQTDDFQAAWAVNWMTDPGYALEESYVNLIPTRLGGTHVNGFRSGLLESLREFCKFRNLLPKGLYLAPEDIWNTVGYVLSVKLSEAQFSGQTKERLSSRHCAGLVNLQVRDAFSLWLNQHVDRGEAWQNWS